MKQYRTVNNLMGWLTFIIAATVYCLTIEPTASFWDCPEFIPAINWKSDTRPAHLSSC